MKFNRLPRFLLLILGVVLNACTGLTPGFEQPQVSLTSFTLAPGSTSTTPRFNIGIRVVNPNRGSLRLGGMTYEVEVEGNRILNGANPDLPTVGGFDSADFVVQAAPDLLGSVRLISELFSKQRSSLYYTFRARINVGNLLPLKIEEKGNFGLPSTR